MKAAIQAKITKMKAKLTAGEKLVCPITFYAFIICSNVSQESDAEDLSLRLDRLKKEEKERARKIKNLETEIIKTKEELAKPPDVKLEKLSDVIDDLVRSPTPPNP